MCFILFYRVSRKHNHSYVEIYFCKLFEHFSASKFSYKDTEMFFEIIVTGAREATTNFRTSLSNKYLHKLTV